MHIYDNKISKIFIETVSVLFSVLFLYTGAMKLIDYPQFSIVLQKYPIPLFLDNPISVILPLIEIAISIGLFFRSTQLLSLKASFWLMLFFTVVVIYIIFFADKMPCSCGGIISSLTFRQHLAVNLISMALAASAIQIKRMSTKK